MKQMAAHMKKVALVVALIAIVFPAVSPVSAQVGTSNARERIAAPNTPQSGSQSGQPAPSQAPTTGTFCIEEMTATFCNVPVGPNTNGYGSAAGTASTSGSASTGGSTGGGGSAASGGSINASSLPPCASRRRTNSATDWTNRARLWQRLRRFPFLPSIPSAILQTPFG
jgi:hypothetical protein